MRRLAYYRHYLGSALVSAYRYTLKCLRLHANRGADFASPWQQTQLLNPNHRGFLLDGRDKALSLNNSYRNVLTLGAVGTGKTSIGVIPSLLRQNTGSKVILDASGEIYDHTAAHLHRTGHRLEVLDLMQHAGHGLQYNPLAGRPQFLDLHKACHLIAQSNSSGSAGDKFWEDGAVNLLALLAACLQNYHPQSCTLENIKILLCRFDLFSAPAGQSIIDRFVLQTTVNAPHLHTSYLSFFNGNPQTVLSWVSTASNLLTPLLSQPMAQLTQCTSFDFADLQREKIALFIKVKPQDIRFYRFVLNLFFEDCLAPSRNKSSLTPSRYLCILMNLASLTLTTLKFTLRLLENTKLVCGCFCKAKVSLCNNTANTTRARF